MGARGLLDDVPRMAPKHRCDTREPIDRKVTLAQFEVADLLVGRPDPRRKLPECEALRLAQMLKAIRQTGEIPGLSSALG